MTEAEMSVANASTHTNGLEVAVVGMAGRFPGARSVAEFWQNLREGSESVSFFTDEELLAAGVEPALLARPDFVRAGARVADPEHFDAAFFGYSHREAELIDPQQRVFLECAHEALEHAGYGAARSRGGRVGVFAGSGLNTYLVNIASNRALLEAFGPIQVAIANDKDYLATRVSYKLDLEGPSVTVQTACSTSLVAVHLACRALLGGDCDVALAGGVSINSFASSGYVYQEGGILSPDGHCRAFDADARGTVFGSGAGVVVLKRLEDALSDGDTVYAVIKGSAVNNDGASKIGYTAPRADGQAEVIRAAQLVAEVEPETITYVEAHGTGTQLGDPIELAALTQAFAAGTSRKNFCAVGSLKTNVGHLDAAAGVAGLIKTTLALRHELLPPTLNFKRPNPGIDFEDSPFYVNAKLAEWKRNGQPRRAGVSSFGIGGTNAHVVVEEAPPAPEASPARERQLLVVSAKTRTALESAAKNLAAYLKSEERASLADAAFTLQVGREAHAERLAFVCGDAAEALEALEAFEGRAARQVFMSTACARPRANVFMFPGQGTQHPNMGLGLYRTEPTFRAQLDRCAELLRAHLGRDIRELLFPAAGEEESAAEQLKQTELTQPALFAVEYALAQLWMEWGVRPAALVGHSVGEYVAACVAGVFTLEDALRLISARGRLLQRLPAGAMLVVPLAEARVLELLGEALSLAAVNAPGLCVVSGPVEEVEALRARLADEGVECSRLHTSHAFHSRMMEPALAPFVREFEGVTLRAPSIPFVSNVTGTWITDAEATSPEYWARHLRRAVRFADNLAAVTEGRACALFEVGPGRTLSTLARQQFGKSSAHALLASLPRVSEGRSDAEQMLASLGQFWAEGGEVDWAGLHADERRTRVPLPTYPFERKRYCIEAARANVAPAASVDVDGDDAEARRQQPALHPRPELQSSYVAPEGETESRVAGIWQELLGTEQVGAEDNFFELGGHSLLATQAVSRLRQEFGLEIPLQALFEGQTVRGVARAVAAAQARAAGDETPSNEDAASGIPRLAPGAPRPLSFAQQRLWFHEQIEPGGALHNMPIAVSLRGPLDLGVTRRALEEIVARHDSLRTTFAGEGGEAVQVIAPSLKLELPVVDLSQLPSGEREAEARRLELEEQRRPFDLAAGPLLRASVLRLAEEEHTLLLTLHHIVSDAWSFAIFTREFSTLYGAFAAGRTSPLAELPVQYADFAAWQRGHLSGGVLAGQLAYWRRQLEGAPPLLALPTDRPRPAVQSHEGATLAFELPAQLVEGLEALARREGATLFMTMLAAFDALLYRYAGQPDVVVGADIAGRNRRELEGLIGFFVNMLVLRTDCSGNPAFTTLLSRVRAVTLGAYEHQDVPFDKLVEELQPPRTAAHSPLFQVVFNYYQDPAEGLDLPGLEVGRISSYPEVSKFDLSLFVGRRADGVGGFWSYSTALFDAARITRLQRMFETLLASIVADPSARLDALDVTPEELKEEQARARRALKESGLKKFKSLKPRAVMASHASVVKTEPMGDGPSFPLVVRPDAEDVDLAAWLAGNAEFVETNLLRYGALLFRGFGVDTLERFDGLTRSLAPALLDYNEPSSPRSQVGRKIYTSTEYPASQWIQLHNEMSYTSRWPHKVFFCCVQPAEAGGETPIAASREVFRLLDPHIARRFIEKRVMYVRNFSPGLDLPWQHVFQTDSPAEVEEYCRASGIEFEWRGPERLRTRQVQQSVIRHASTQDLVWFNQAHAFHAASLESSVRAALGAEMGEDEFPRNAYYGDGTPIEDSVIEAIRDAYRRAAVSFPWQRGDVLVLENMLFAHGRAPFSGPRKVLVAMSGLVSAGEVDTVGA